MHRDGLIVQTYRKCANILKEFYLVETVVNCVNFLSVEPAVDNLFIKLLNEDEGVEIIQNCSSCEHGNKEKNNI